MRTGAPRTWRAGSISPGARLLARRAGLEWIAVGGTRHASMRDDTVVASSLRNRQERQLRYLGALRLQLKSPASVVQATTCGNKRSSATWNAANTCGMPAPSHGCSIVKS